MPGDIVLREVAIGAQTPQDLFGFLVNLPESVCMPLMQARVMQRGTRSADIYFKGNVCSFFLLIVDALLCWRCFATCSPPLCASTVEVRQTNGNTRIHAWRPCWRTMRNTAIDTLQYPIGTMQWRMLHVLR